MSETVLFARRFSRARFIRRAPVVVGVAVLFVVALTMTIQALTLSPSQVLERDQGRFEWKTDLNSADIRGYTPRSFPKIRAAMDETPNVRDVDLEWVSYDIKPSAAPTTFTSYHERDWTGDPLPGRFVQVSGRMPEKAGEAAISQSMAKHVRDGQLSVLSGRVSLQVVGVIDDRYMGEELLQILAGAQTAEGFSDAVLKAFPTLGGISAAYWDGGSTAEVVAALTPILQPSSADPAAVYQLLSGATESRAEIAAQPVPSLTERFPLLGWVLAIGLPLVAGITAAGGARRHAQRRARALVGLGVSRSAARRALASALAVSALWWSVVGVVGGVIVTIVARLVIDRFWAYQPLSPLTLPWGAIVLAIVAALVGLLVTVVPGLGTLPTTTPTTDRQQSSWPTFLRRSAALAGMVALIQLADSTTSMPKSMTFVGISLAVALLAIPDIVPLALRLLPEGNARQRLVVRQLRGDTTRAQGATMMLMLAVALPVAFFTVTTTVANSAQAGRVSEVPRGQIQVNDGQGGREAPRPEVVDAVRANLPDAPTLRLAIATKRADYAVGIRGEDAMSLWVLDSPTDVERFMDSTLTQAQRDTLTAGGILTWDGKPAGPRQLVELGGTAPVATVTAAPAVISPSWQQGSAGLLLRDSLAGHGLRSYGGQVIFTGVSDADAEVVSRDIVERGMDVRQVVIHEPPSQVIIRLGFTVAAVLLAAIVVLSSLVLFRGQARAMSSYLGGLIAIGVSPKWVSGLLVRQAGIVCALGATLGLAIGIAGVAVFARAHTAINLEIPWLATCAAVGTAIAAALAVSYVSGRTLRAADRLAD